MDLCSSSDHLSHGSSSEQSEYSSDPDCSDSSHSDSFEESSSSELSFENEDMQEERRDEDGSDDCIIVSSDEESMQMEAPKTPLAPLTPGAELDPCLATWLHVEDPKDSLRFGSQLQSRYYQEYLHPLSSAGFPGGVLYISLVRV